MQLILKRVINSRNKQFVSNANFIENEPVLKFLAKRVFHAQIPVNQKPGSQAGFLCLRFLWFGRRIRRRLMPRDFFQYLVEVCLVFIAAEGAGGFDKGL